MVAPIEPGGLFVEAFGHQVTLMIEEATAAVEFDGGVAVGDLEMEEFGFVLARDGFGEVKKLCADSLSAMRSLDGEFVNPRSLAAVFETVVEADHQVADGHKFFSDEVNHAVNRIRQQLGQIRADRGLVEWLRPGIIRLHVAHHLEEEFEVSQRG